MLTNKTVGEKLGTEAVHACGRRMGVEDTENGSAEVEKVVGML
jgi:hypothetical protein